MPSKNKNIELKQLFREELEFEKLKQEIVNLKLEEVNLHLRIKINKMKAKTFMFAFFISVFILIFSAIRIIYL
jgi:hypothetical protein